MKYLALSSLLLLAGCLDQRDADTEMSTSRWRYDPAAHHYEHLSTDLQQASAEDPSRLAASICAELAGELGFISSGDADRVSFTCHFEEAGQAFSLDFGALVRN